MSVKNNAKLRTVVEICKVSINKISIHLGFEYFEHLGFFKTGSMHTIVPPNHILLGLHGHLNYQINRYLNHTRATLYK